MLSASDSCRLTIRIKHASMFSVRATIGVAVRRLTEPSSGGAKPSSTNINARRDGTINVGLSDVVIAIIAPSVTKLAAPHGRYFIATSVIGVALDWSCDKGSTPNATIDIDTNITAVNVMPRKNTSGNLRVLSFVSPAVCASDP